MQLAKVELFGINICGQQRYSNSNNNNATNNNNCKSIGRYNDRPALFVFVLLVLYWHKCVCVCVRFLCTLCAHCLGSVCIFQFVLWIMQFIQFNFAWPQCPRVCVCVCECFVYMCHPMINSMAARNMEIKTQQQSLHPFFYTRVFCVRQSAARSARHSEQRAH